MNHQTASLKSIKTIANSTQEATFTAPVGFTFKAGQYATITLPQIADQPDREQYRDFSIASPPEMLPLFQIAFRQTDSLFKRTLANLPAGSQVQVEGPAGIFTLPPAPQKFVCVAGGIGVTPFRSMLESKAKHGPSTLLSFNTSPENAPYREELAKLDNADYIEYFERPKTSQFEALAADLSDTLWLVAGPPDFVTAVRKLLEALAVSDTMLRTEEFSGYEAHH